jgi:hypothetical protein
VCINIISVSSVSIIIPVIVHFSMDNGWIRFLVTSSTSVICSSIVILFIGCNHTERLFILGKIPIIKHWI